MAQNYYTCEFQLSSREAQIPSFHYGLTKNTPNVVVNQSVYVAGSDGTVDEYFITYRGTPGLSSWGSSQSWSVTVDVTTGANKYQHRR